MRGDIIRHHRTSSGTRGLSRAVWPVAGYSDGDGSSRAVSSVAGSCAVGSVACRRARRRITCRRARREIASHHSAIRFGDLGVPAMPTVGHPEGPSPAMPRPNIRLSPTPPTSVCERLFFCIAVALHECPFGGAAKAGRWAALIPKYGCRTVVHRCPPLPDTNQCAPITTHGYRSAGKPAIHDAHAGHGPDESARSLCGVPVMPDESDRPSCGMPVVPDESDRPSCGVPVGVRRVPCGTSPGRCSSCRRVPCMGESRSLPVVPASPVHGRVPVAARRLPCPGPTYACSRRRQPWFTNVYSFASPWRFMNARSAARLTRIVGRPQEQPPHLHVQPGSRTRPRSAPSHAVSPAPDTAPKKRRRVRYHQRRARPQKTPSRAVSPAPDDRRG